MAPIGLKHWMLHNNQLANEYDETLKLSPGYDPVRAADPALTFYAPLLTGPDSIPGAIRAVFERNSQGTYQAPRGAHLLRALDDESRHEYTPHDEPLGALLEPAITNKCENYNADADDALTNMRLSGIADGVLSAVKDEESLARSGLSSIVGKVFFLDNRGNGLPSFVQTFGECDNLNPHSAHVYMRVLQGIGGFGIRFDQSDLIELEANDRYEKVTLANVTPDSVNNRASIKADSDSAVYFILNQLEEASVVSSAIITEGAPTSRAVDQLSWPLWGGPYGLNLFANIANDPQWQSTDPNVTIGEHWATWSGVQTDDQGIYTTAGMGMEAGKTYKLRYQVRNYDAGQHRVQIDNNVIGEWNTGNGYFEIFLSPTAADSRILLYGDSNLVADISLSPEIREAKAVLNQAEGMSAVLFRPSFDQADLSVGVLQSQFLISLQGNRGSRWQKSGVNESVSFFLFDGVTDSFVTTSEGMIKNRLYLIMSRWRGLEKQIGYKAAGSVTWGNVDSFTGSFDNEGVMHLGLPYVNAHFSAHYTLLHLWNEDRGTAWLNEYFSGVAN